MSAPTSTKSALAKRKFTIKVLPTPELSPALTRHIRRIYLHEKILAAGRICCGDRIVLRRWEADEVEQGEAGQTGLEKGMEGVKLNGDDGEGKENKFVVGIAWPKSTLSGYEIEAHPLMLANAGLSLTDTASISTFAASGLNIVEATNLTLIYDGKGSAARRGHADSLFESTVRDLVCDIGYIAPQHFVETYYNGLTRRLLVATLRGPPAPKGTPTPDPSNTVYLLSRSTTEIAFKPPQAHAPKRKPAASGSGSGAAAKATPVAVADGGDLAGYEAVGGMERQIEEIRELVEWPLTRPELFRHFGLRPPKGVLLYGPPGTGKTLLAFSIAKSTGSTLFTINGPSLSSAYHGETEKALRDIFAEAKRKSPSIIVIDEVDALAPNREEGGEVERRVVAQLLTLMDGLEEKDPEPKAKEERDDEDAEDDGEEEKDKEPPRVVVIAATNRPNAIDPALRRPGRFDKEIEIGVPDAASRLSILRVLLRRTPHNLPDDALVSVASKTHGFVGADLSSLVHTAGLSALKRAFPLLGQPAAPPLSSMQLNRADLEHALLATRPSAMREVFLETPKVLWTDIGGQEVVKARLRESVEWPLRHPEVFARLGVKPPRGILLYGPPGCSKTLIAKALATEGGLNFIAVKGPEIFNKYVGESEKAVREIFRKARAAAPSVVFLDEIDALAPARGGDDGGGATSDRVLLSLLTEMDGVEELNGVVVLAATNRPDVIDPALMRPGRLDRILYVSPPDRASRTEIFRLNFAKMAVAADVNKEELATITEGCSGAEIASICQDAALRAMNVDMNTPAIGAEYFLAAARAVRRRITPEVIRGYEEWRDSSGMQSA